MNNILNSPSVLEMKSERTFLWRDDEFTLVFSPTIDALRDWPGMEADNVMMSANYLRAIETAPPKFIDFLYAVLYDSKEKLLGYYYFQYKQFNAKESINYSPATNWRQKWMNAFKQSVSSMLGAKGLVSGNLLVTGDHGKICLAASLNEEDKQAFYTQVQVEALKYSAEQGKKVKFVLGKDYETEALAGQLDWNSVKVQPNMIMRLRPTWDSMDTYFADMKPKYRKRNKSALKKAAGFRFEEVGIEEIEANIDWIYKLYLEIVERAPFNMFILSKEYFVSVKRNLGDACDFSFVYDGDQLVAFQVNLLNHDLYEAHFLGYDHTYLRSHDLYLNLLLNTVRLGIERKVKTIIFSRTAMQIKSSIGAVPEELYLYLNVQSKILNRLVKFAFKYLNPPVVFEQRHPFKES